MEIKKVVIVTNIPNPYRIPLFNEIQRQLEERAVKLKVLFGARTYSRRKSEIDLSACSFEYDFLNSKTFHFGNREKTIFTYSGLGRALNREKADRILINGFSMGTLHLFLRSFFRKTHYLIWSGSIEKEGRNDSFLRILQRKLLIKRAKGFVAYGSLAGKYLQKLGANEQRIHIGINTVDTGYFAAETGALRSVLSENRKFHLLYVGYLSERKNVSRLLKVVESIAQKRRNFVLDIVGSGPDENRLKKFVADHKLEDLVHFHGFKQKEELPAFFAGSSMFLFQTDFDIWGLVLNEAMAAGVPCISSIHAGASADLIEQGENGFVVDFSEKDKVTELVLRLMENEGLRNSIAKHASQFISEKANLRVSAEGFVQALLQP